MRSGRRSLSAPAIGLLLTAVACGPNAGSAAGWSKLPDSPLGARDGHAGVWTGSEMLVVGGCAAMDENDVSEPFANGALYDPNTREWSKLSAPLPPGRAEALRVGDDVLVLGGGGCGDPHARPALAVYDSRAGKWHRLAPPPGMRVEELEASNPAEAYVWGSERRDGRRRDALLAFRPQDRSWRVIDLPGGIARPDVARPAVVWAGDRLILWGAGGESFSPGGEGYVLEPRSRRWKQMPRPPQLVWSDLVAWTGSVLIVCSLNDPTHDRAPGCLSFDPSRAAWSTLAAWPLSTRYGHSSAWTGRELIVWGGHHIVNIGPFRPGERPKGPTEQIMDDGAVYDPARDSWRQLPEAPLSGRLGATEVWTGSKFVVWGGHGGCGRGRCPKLRDGASYRPEPARGPDPLVNPAEP